MVKMLSEVNAVEYITVSEASKMWGISSRRINYILTAGRIPGAVKTGKLWLIPADAQRPVDGRRRVTPAPPSLADDLAAVIASAAVPMPADNPDAILDTLSQERLRLQYEGDLAYLRGDFARTMSCYKKTEGDDAARMRACPIAIAAAISLGAYDSYTEIESYLKKKCTLGGSVRAIAELCLATAAVSVIAPNMVPEWLKTGDMSALPPQALPNAFSLRAKYFLCIGQYEAMLATAQTAQALSAAPGGITTTDIYLRVSCAVACHYMGNIAEAKRHLLDAMGFALPHGFITPFAEQVPALCGLVEQCLEQAFPAYLNTVLAQWERSGRNWFAFHNRFTRENLTLVLTLREYQIAQQVAHRVPYAKIARQQGVSEGRLKNIIQDIYEKLFVTGRNELAKLVF